MKKIKATLNEDNVKFFCNEKKVVVVCIIESYVRYSSLETPYDCMKIRCIGKAICGKDDKYNEVKGRQIAESRAKVELYRSIKELIVELKRQFFNEEMDLANQKVRYERLISKKISHIKELTL